MQNLHARAGARGWVWRIERIETVNRVARAGFLHLSRQTDRATETLTAVRPFEPIAKRDGCEELRPVPARVALSIAQAAKHGERIAFSLAAVERLNGDMHPWQLAAALVFERGHPRVLLAD